MASDLVASPSITPLKVAMPLVIVGMLLIVLLPLPVTLVDVLLCANLALSVLLLMLVLTVHRASDLSLFPVMLLGLTLLRTGLNIATTRLILTGGGTSGAVPPDAIAGEVIDAFGQLMAAGNLVAGFVIFGIITIVQFVVITRGAGRIGEVAARFALEALPGRQAAIDAELRSGAISREQAAAKREQLVRDADFYGSLDGVGKFLRGDAIAGLLIVAINLIGGMLIGIIWLDWPIDTVLRTFSQLTIGDGLASQVPAVLCSVAAGLLVIRGGHGNAFAPTFHMQLLRQPQALAATAALAAILGIITPLPTWPLLGVATVLAVAAMVAVRPQPSTAIEPRPSTASAMASPAIAGSLSPMPNSPGVLQVAVGDANTPLAPSIQATIPALRQAVAESLGLPLPGVDVTADSELPPTGYELRLWGEPIAAGVVYPGARLVPSPAARASRTLLEPFDQVAAHWDVSQPGEEAADGRLTMASHELPAHGGFTPVEVVVRHLHRVVIDHADEVLTFERFAAMVRPVWQQSPHLKPAADAETSRLRLLYRVAQALLREHVPLRSMSRIVEIATEAAEENADWVAVLGVVRRSMGRSLVRGLLGDDGSLRAIELATGWHGQSDAVLRDYLTRCDEAFAARPVFMVAASERLATWQRLRRLGRPAACLSADELPPGQSVIVLERWSTVEAVEGTQPLARVRPVRVTD